MTSVEMIDQETAARRRKELLAGLGFDETELRRRARSYQLTDHEFGLLDRLDELDFLLGR